MISDGGACERYRAPASGLQPFDVVFVPATFIAKANLAVQKYMYDLPPVTTYENFACVLGDRATMIR